MREINKEIEDRRAGVLGDLGKMYKVTFLWFNMILVFETFSHQPENKSFISLCINYKFFLTLLIDNLGFLCFGG